MNQISVLNNQDGVDTLLKISLDQTLYGWSQLKDWHSAQPGRILCC